MGKFILVLLFSGSVFLMGVAQGHNRSPEPKVITKIKVVSVPEVIVRAETKTVTTHEPLPATCEEAIKTLDGLQAFDGVVSQAATDTMDGLGNGVGKIALKDYIGANKITEEMMVVKDDLFLAILGQKDIVNLFQSQLTQCRKDVSP